MWRRKHTAFICYVVANILRSRGTARPPCFKYLHLSLHFPPTLWLTLYPQHTDSCWIPRPSWTPTSSGREHSLRLMSSIYNITRPHAQTSFTPRIQGILPSKSYPASSFRDPSGFSPPATKLLVEFAPIAVGYTNTLPQQTLIGVTRIVLHRVTGDHAPPPWPPYFGRPRAPRGHHLSCRT